MRDERSKEVLRLKNTQRSLILPSVISLLMPTDNARYEPPMLRSDIFIRMIHLYSVKRAIIIENKKKWRTVQMSSGIDSLPTCIPLLNGLEITPNQEITIQSKAFKPNTNTPYRLSGDSLIKSGSVSDAISRWNNTHQGSRAYL